MQLVEKGLRELMQNPKIYERRVRVRVIGRLEMLPENTEAALWPTLSEETAIIWVLQEI